MVRQGQFWNGAARFGRHGMAGFGKAGGGLVRFVKARSGTAGEA